MFAPVYYPQPVYAQPGFVFTPSISIVGSAVTANLFVSAGTNQYLFGNFYAQNFVSVGIMPWFSFSFVDRPAGLLRPAVLVLRGGQRAAEPALDRAGARGVRPAPRQRRDAAAEHVRRADAVIERNVSITRNITVVDHRNMAMPLRQLAADPIAGRNLRMVRVAEAERQQIAAPGGRVAPDARAAAAPGAARWPGAGRPAVRGRRTCRIRRSRRTRRRGRPVIPAAIRRPIRAARVPARRSRIATRRRGSEKPRMARRHAAGPSPPQPPGRIGPCRKVGPGRPRPDVAPPSDRPGARPPARRLVPAREVASGPRRSGRRNDARSPGVTIIGGPGRHQPAPPRPVSKG